MKPKYNALCPHCMSDDVALTNATAFYNGKGSWVVETYLGSTIECYSCGGKSEEPAYVELCS